jgi:hypothetical protein
MVMVSCIHTSRESAPERRLGRPMMITPWLRPDPWDVDDCVEVCADAHLASEAGLACPLCRGAVKHFVFVLAELGQSVLELRTDVDVACGAHGLAAAFSHNAFNAVGDRGAHE